MTGRDRTRSGADPFLRILAEIRKWTWIGAACAVAGSASLVALVWLLTKDFSLDDGDRPPGWDRMLNGLKNGALWFMLAAAGALAKSRGRSAWFALLGAFSCLGIAITLVLPKRCQACGAPGGVTANACAKCGAPLSLRWVRPPARDSGAGPVDSAEVDPRG